MQGMVVPKTNNEARNIAFTTATNSLCSVALNEAVRQPTSTAVCSLSQHAAPGQCADPSLQRNLSPFQASSTNPAQNWRKKMRIEHTFKDGGWG